MKNILIILFLLVSSVVSGQNTKKTIELPEFKSIYNNSNYSIYLKQTNKQEVAVEALTEIFDVTEIKVENGVLIVNVDRKPDNQSKSVWAKIDDIKINPTMKLIISMKSIQELQVNGGGKIIAENSLASDKLSLVVTGSGGLDLDVKGNEIDGEVSGSGNIAIKGYATSLNVLMSGSGAFNGFNCELESAKVKMSGSGACELNVTGSLDAFVSGSGTLKHKGNTKNVIRKIYGSGTVDRAY